VGVVGCQGDCPQETESQSKDEPHPLLLSGVEECCEGLPGAIVLTGEPVPLAQHKSREGLTPHKAGTLQCCGNLGQFFHAALCFTSLTPRPGKSRFSPRFIRWRRRLLDGQLATGTCLCQILLG